MRHHLLASTGLVSTAAISAALLSLGATSAQAETSIGTARTTAVTTSTVGTGGTPDDVKITSAGSVILSSGAGTNVVTINSNHKVVNEGTIQFSNVNNTSGIVADAGVTSEITNGKTGKIIIDESYAPTDTDNDGDIDGPFATGTGRAGIKTLGAFTGNISNEGSIQVEGNNSYGIVLGGALNGKFVNNGSITVLGDNTTAVELGAVNTTGTAGSGNVRLAGSISAQGANAVAARMTGPIAGTLEIQGTLTATGYRYTTAPADPSKLDADDLLIGGSAVVVAGNVQGGIILAVPPKDTSGTGDDRDNDGIKDSEEGSAVVRSYGTAPAMLIGHASDNITIGSVPGTGASFGLINDGTIAGYGVYAGKAANGLQIGGLGGNVTITGGIRNAGVIGAQSKDVAATAVRIGSGANVGTILNTGRIEAITDGKTNAAVATAIQIDAGSTLTSIENSNIIGAKTGGETGVAIAIKDASGLVTSVKNSGSISATGSTTAGNNVAIDLSAGTTAQTIHQTAVAAGYTAPTITGDIKFGSGAGTLKLDDGLVKGNVSFGNAANSFSMSGDAVYEGTASFGSGNDSLTLGGTSYFVGSANFGGGTDVLTINDTAVYSGKLTNAAGLTANVNGGAFDVKGAATIAALNVTGGGRLAVTIGGDDATALTVTGTADFAADSKLIIQLDSLDQTNVAKTVLTANAITGANNLATNSDLLPFLYKGTLDVDGNALKVTVGRKSNSELGLNRSESAAFDAILAAAEEDELVEDTVLALRSAESFHGTLSQMLPEHEAGIFETATSGSRALARFLSDANAPYKDEGKWGWFVNQAVWGHNKKVGDTAGYKVSGWGISLGGEVITDIGNFGLSAAFLNGKDSNKSNANEVTSNHWEGALHWRIVSNGIQAHARVSGAPISLNGTRIFNGIGDASTGTRTIKGKWDAKLYSASGAVSYDTRAAGFTLRPTVAVDYYKLSEDGYQETGGGDALDLKVNSRSSDELAVTGSVALGLEFGGRDEYDGWTRFEFEAGRRQLVGGSLGSLTASFKDGDPFTLTPEERTSGWLGRLRGLAGNSGFQFGGELSAERQQGHTAWAFRASLRVGL